jgi:dihydrofolate synthase / folylpolyglutamate synthase
MSNFTKQYQETVEFLYGNLPMYHRIGALAYRKDLTNIRKLCDFLGNPQDKITTIHVAGTNGKGSTSYMLSATLQAHGLKTGLYISRITKIFESAFESMASTFPKNLSLNLSNTFEQP